MEELRSTEVLDREILEDARKKAFKILKTADDTVEAQTKRAEKKTQKALNEIRKTYERRTQKVQEEILARLPLDKRRLRSEIAEHFLNEAMNDFLKNLERRDLLSILEKELQKLLAACEDFEKLTEEKIRITYFAMDEAEAKTMLQKLFNRNTGKSWTWEKQEGHAGFPAVILNTPRLKISASVESTAGDVLKDRRAELAACLLGEGVLND